MTEWRAYDELVDLIAAGPSPELVATFRPSEATRRRVAELVAREKTIGLGAAESSELEHYLQLEHLLRLAEARARRHPAP
jgi:hypothetical protein